MYSKKSQSELIENKDYNMVLLLPHNATKIIYFSKSFSIRFFLLVIKEYYVFLKVAANVRRYVQLAQSRGGACFCTRGAMQGYDVVLFILALAKTVTPGGSPRREPGRPAPPLTFYHFD